MQPRYLRERGVLSPLVLPEPGVTGPHTQDEPFREVGHLLLVRHCV